MGFPLRGIPGLNVVVHLTEPDCAKTEPENHAAGWKKVFGRDLERVHDEKAVKEVDR